MKSNSLPRAKGEVARSSHSAIRRDIASDTKLLGARKHISIHRIIPQEDSRTNSKEMKEILVIPIGFCLLACVSRHLLQHNSRSTDSASKNKNPRCSAQDLREGSYAEYRGFYLIFPELYTTLRFDNKRIKTRIVEIAMGA